MFLAVVMSIMGVIVSQDALGTSGIIDAEPCFGRRFCISKKNFRYPMPALA